MLAGLLFATHDAEDRPDRLAATLPFGGLTLIEYQARLLIGAGASQIIVVVSRLTPELLGAISRIGRRGVAVDPVRSAAEAAEKLHPLARVLMFADGLVTTDAITGLLAGEGGDALLVVDDGEGTGFERLGGGKAWGGIARLDPRRLTEVAALPKDYDMQSTLLRVAAQVNAAHIQLPAAALRGGHGIERRALGLEERGHAVLTTIVAQRTGWFDRVVLAPIARRALPALVERTVPGSAIGAGGAVLGSGGLAALLLGFPGTGLVLSLAGTIVFALGTTLGWMRDEPVLARGQEIAAGVLPALAVLLLGREESGAHASGTALTLALAAIVTAALGERATEKRPRKAWWGSPPAHLTVAMLCTLAGFPVVGLGIVALYAGITLAAAIEALRQQP